MVTNQMVNDTIVTIAIQFAASIMGKFKKSLCHLLEKTTTPLKNPFGGKFRFTRSASVIGRLPQQNANGQRHSFR